MSDTVKPAPVKWAQRGDLVYLHFEVQDVSNPDVKVEPTKVTYSGVTSDNQKYETVINLYDTIVPDESKWINRDRGAEFVLIKEKKGPYWTRLLKESTKYHWLRVDFNKWKDEDESDEEEAAAGGLGGAGGAGGVDFANMMRQMGGMGGMGGMGDMGGMPDFGDMGGMPPMEGGDEENDSDEEMPGLEEDASKP